MDNLLRQFNMELDRKVEELSEVGGGEKVDRGMVFNFAVFSQYMVQEAEAKAEVQRAKLDATAERESRSPEKVHIPANGAEAPLAAAEPRTGSECPVAGAGDCLPELTAPIDALPEDAFCHILSFLTVPERLSLALVSRHWRRQVSNSLARSRDLSMDMIPGISGVNKYVTNETLNKILSRLPGLLRLGELKCVNLDEDYISFFNIEPPCILSPNLLTRHCKQLVEANLQSFLLDVPSLERLCSGCPRLEALSLPKSCDDACVEAVLRGLPGLCSLDMDLTNLTGRCLVLLPASLRCLKLRGRWGMRSADLGQAARCPELKELDITRLNQPPPAELVKLLTICPGLEVLHAQHCRITDGFVKQLSAKTPGLRCLNVTGCTQLTESGLTKLAELRELRSLDLFDTAAGDALLDRLHDAPHLIELSIGSDEGRRRWGNYSTWALCRLVRACPTIKSLIVSREVELDELVMSLSDHLDEDRDVTLHVPEGEMCRCEPPEPGNPLKVEPY